MSTQQSLRTPYTLSRSSRPPGNLVGRDALLMAVEQELRAPERNAVVLCGPRRIGKTAVLLELLQHLPSPSFMPVYFDLMGWGELPLGRFLYELAAGISAAAGLPAPDSGRFDDRGALFVEEFLPSLYRALGEEIRPVLLLDQLDQLNLGVPGVPAVVGYLRRLVHAERRLGFVITLDKRPEDLPTELKAMIRGARCERVSLLEADPARFLIGVPRRPGSPRLSSAAVDRVLALSGAHPYFIQLLCEAVAQGGLAASPHIAREVEPGAIDAALPRALDLGQSGLSWIWDGLDAAERAAAAAVAVAGERAIVTRGELAAKLDSLGVGLGGEELTRALDSLVEDAVLQAGAGGYFFTAEILRRWVAEHRPLVRVSREMARPASVADTLYQSALALHQQQDEEGAHDILQRALRLEPEHRQSRLLLGQVLLRLGRAGDALLVLAEAYRAAPAEARPLLVEALLAVGEEHERNGDDERALASYKRLGELAPGEPQAEQRRVALLLRRGEAAERAGEYDKAVAAYRDAGATDKVAALRAQQRRRNIERLARDAEDRRRGEDWEVASEIYRRLAAEEPEERRWSQALAEVEAELELARRYEEGRAASEKGDKAAALKALGWVVATRSGYKDAEQLLGSVTQGPAPMHASQPVQPLQPPPRPRTPRKRTPALLWGAAVVAVLAALGLGGLAAHRASQGPAAPPRPEQSPAAAAELSATWQLLEIDRDLLDHHWAEAAGKLDALARTPGAAQKVRDAAAQRRELLHREQEALALYTELLAASKDPPEVIVQLYRRIPADASYRTLARPRYEQALDRFARERLRRASSARSSKHCAEALALVQEVLDVEPTHPGALEAKDRPCKEKESDSGSRVAKSPERSSGSSRSDGRADRVPKLPESGPLFGRPQQRKGREKDKDKGGICGQIPGAC